jgi:uncharacterized protein involved in propanediol utilization
VKLLDTLPPECIDAAPAAALFSSSPHTHRVGRGRVRAHHGEIVQGVFESREGSLEHGLVTLPCPLFETRVRFRPMRSAPLTVHPGDRPKARAAARLALDELGRGGWGGRVRIDSNVPLAWGCGSSTTDVLAVIRAVADAFHAQLEPEQVARLAVASETASDSLMYPAERALLFAQRRGCVLEDLRGPLPSVRVLGFNTEVDRGVETLALPPCNYAAWEVDAFRGMLALLRRAVEQGDPELLGRAATDSARINQRHRPKRQMDALLRLAREAGAVGTQVAHSGTVAGFLFAPFADVGERIARASDGLAALGLGRGWEFSTDYGS